MGENTDDMTTSTAKLRNEIKAMTGGFDIMKNENEFKSIYEIMDGLAEAVKDMEDIDKTALIEKIAGKNRANQVSALLNNWSQAEKALETSQNSLGSAAKENAAYIDSIDGRIAQLKASFEDFSNTVINSEFIKELVNGLNEIIKAADFLVETFGVLPTSFATAMGAMAAYSKIKGHDNFFDINKFWKTDYVAKFAEYKKNKNNEQNVIDATPELNINEEQVAENLVSQTTEALNQATPEIEQQIEKEWKAIKSYQTDMAGIEAGKLSKKRKKSAINKAENKLMASVNPDKPIGERDSSVLELARNYQELGDEAKEFEEFHSTRIVQLTKEASQATEELKENIAEAVTEGSSDIQDELYNVVDAISGDNEDKEDSSDTQENVANVVEQFEEVAEASDEAKISSELMAETLADNVNEAMEETGETAKNVSDSIEGIEEAGEKGGKGVSKFAQGLQTLGKTLAISAAIWAVTKIIEGISNKLHEVDNEIKELQDSVQELGEEYQDALSEIENTDSRLEEIQNRIKEINDNQIDLINSEELAELEKETEQLKLQKENLEEIAKLKQQAAQNKTNELLNDKDAFYITENGLEAGYGGFKNEYIKMVNDRDDSDTILIEAIKGLTTKIPLLSDAAMALAYAFTGNKSDRKTQSQHIEDLIAQYESLVSINSSLSSTAMTNADVLKQYLDNESEIASIEETLSQVSATLTEQLSTLSEDSELYKQINGYISDITTAFNTKQNIPESTAVQVYNNYVNNYEGFEEGYVKYKDIIEKGKNSYQDKEEIFVAGTNERYRAFSALQNGNDSKILNELLSKHNINMQGGSLTAQSYEDLLAFQYDLNQAKQSGLMTDKENLEILNKLLKNLTGIDGSECTVYIRYEQEQGMYDELFNGTYNGINYSEVGVDNYLLFKNGFISAMKTQGKDTELAEAILETMFPNLQTSQDRLKEAFSSVPEITGVKEELLAYARSHKFTGETLEKYGLTEIFEGMGISANEAGAQVLSLARALIKEEKAASKVKVQTLNIEFSANKADFDENYKDTKNTYETIIQSFKSGEKNALSYDEVWSLIEADSSLANEFEKTADGYSISVDKLLDSYNRFLEENKNVFSDAIEDAEVGKQEAVNTANRIKQDLRGTTNPSDIAYLSKLLKEQEGIIDDYDDIIAKNTILLDQCTESTNSYIDTIEQGCQALSKWESAYEQAVGDMSSINKLTPDSILALQELSPDNWKDFIDIGNTGNLIFNEDAFMKQASITLGYESSIEKAKENLAEAQDELQKFLDDNSIDFDLTGNAESDITALNDALADASNVDKFGDKLEDLKEKYKKAAKETLIAVEALQMLFEAFKESTALTKFNDAVEGIDHKLAMGEISQKQHDSEYADYLSNLEAEAKANGEYENTDVKSALNSGWETIHSNEQSALQKQLEKETQDIEEQYEERLINADEYNRQMSALEDKYYGTETSRGLLDDPDSTNLDTVAEARKTRITKMYEGDVADADKLLEKGVINNTQYANEMRKIWEKYYKDKEGFAQESYEAEQKYLEAVKSDVQIQIDGVQSLIDKNEAKIEAQIEGIEAENDEIEKLYDDEIAKIDEQIELLEDKADEEERYLEYKKAERELEKASQKTRKVYASNGTVQYRQDEEAIEDAQKNLNDLKKEELVAKLEEQKEALEEEKEKALEINNQRIEDLNANLAAINQPLEALVAAMAANLAAEYNLSPEAIAAILSTEASQQGLDEYNEQNSSAGKDTYSMEAVAEAGYGAASKVNSELISQDKKDEQLKQGYTVIDSSNFESRQGSKIQQLLDLMMTSPVNEYVYDNEGQKNKWKADVSDYDWGTAKNQQMIYQIGDIVITNPVGNSDDLAKEFATKFPNAIYRQMYTNLKK